MKALFIWLTVMAVIFGAFAVVTSVLRDTTRVFVVVDSSFPMKVLWRQVPGELDEIDNKGHAEFALATEKEAIHTWSPALTISGVEPFAPCTFDTITAYPEVAEADELILITTSSSCDTAALTDWKITFLEP
ncbi:MAG: hypothetical protein ACC660_07440 [Acidimicrobiales bacterium]